MTGVSQHSLDAIHEELELDEAQLFGQDDDDRPGASEEGSEDDDGDLEDASSHNVPADVPPGDAGEGSAKSSTMHVTLREADEEDEFDVNHRRPGARSGAFSMPAQPAIRMGSSVPISIPMLGRWKKEDESGSNTEPAEPEPQYPATFIPPHQLSQRDDFMFSFTGESPGFVLKKERLRVRNAILKSTGFLEPGVQAMSTHAASERNRPVIGGLSQALHGAVSS